MLPQAQAVTPCRDCAAGDVNGGNGRDVAI